ncbi:MAG: PadR family transcriptional regulator [Candidatus Aminicenantes bacterium]|nr:MAG: PadR family transcriptional regulator [Candidatus Aminicenantes bacterium]
MKFKMNIITRLEEAILIAIWRLEDNAYGVTINKHVSRSFKKSYSLGSLYFSLDQLLRKGYVSKTITSFYHEKGGRSRTYYSLTEEGKRALQEVKAYQKSLWDGIPEMAFEVKKSK